MGRKKKQGATAVEAVPEVATSVVAAPENPSLSEQIAAIPKPDPRPTKRKKSDPAAAGVVTLADLAAAYLAHMEGEGKSEGTIASYRMELKTAMVELGETVQLADLTPPKVMGYFDSARVTKLRSGKPKAKPSIEKTRRVLRLALVWAAERGIVDRYPLPEATRS